jgi:hypothetical protein
MDKNNRTGNDLRKDLPIDYGSAFRARVSSKKILPLFGSTISLAP